MGVLFSERLDSPVLPTKGLCNNDVIYYKDHFSNCQIKPHAARAAVSRESQDVEEGVEQGSTPCIPLVLSLRTPKPFLTSLLL
jgi:hypothetical protein